MQITTYPTAIHAAPSPTPHAPTWGWWNGVWERGCVLAAAIADTEHVEAGAKLLVKEKVA